MPAPKQIMITALIALAAVYASRKFEPLNKIVWG